VPARARAATPARVSKRLGLRRDFAAP
jgi:hypothetical protein